MPQRPLEARGPVAATSAPRPHTAPAEGVVLRDATAADIDAIVALTNAAYTPRDSLIFGRDRTDTADVKAAITDAESTYVVADLSGVVAAAVRFELKAGDAYFGPLATSPEYQGRGLAPALIGECERRARAAGRDTIRIGVIREVGMEPYYETLGYERTGETPGHELSWGANTPKPFTLVHMQKALR